ncbi:hypothetical protein Tco_0176926 [Tanacetum coccineum]
MLGPGRYSQWRSRFLRYIDTKGNGEYLRKCIFEGPYKLTSVVIEAVAATVNAPAVPEHDEAEIVHNMSEENKLYFKAEKEAIFFLLTGIGDEIYSTVDACNTANEIWTAIERLQQGESLNIQNVCSHQFRPRLVLHQMTSDHNRSELRNQDHSNEQSSSKLVPKVVP